MTDADFKQTDKYKIWQAQVDEIKNKIRSRLDANPCVEERAIMLLNRIVPGDVGYGAYVLGLVSEIIFVGAGADIWLGEDYARGAVFECAWHEALNYDWKKIFSGNKKNNRKNEGAIMAKNMPEPQINLMAEARAESLALIDKLVTEARQQTAQIQSLENDLKTANREIKRGRRRRLWNSGGKGTVWFMTVTKRDGTPASTTQQWQILYDADGIIKFQNIDTEEIISVFPPSHYN
jgi:hypothetical protein